jgi:hypothetical protein
MDGIRLATATTSRTEKFVEEYTHPKIALKLTGVVQGTTHTSRSALQCVLLREEFFARTAPGTAE